MEQILHQIDFGKLEFLKLVTEPVENLQPHLTDTSLLDTDMKHIKPYIKEDSVKSRGFGNIGLREIIRNSTIPILRQNFTRS